MPDLRKILPPPALIALVILAAAAIALQIVASSQGWVLRKQPAELRQPLFYLDNRKTLGSFQQDRILPRLSAEMLEELGTEHYTQILYLDGDAPSNTPGRQIQFHVSFHTGLMDARPQVDLKSTLAHGAEPKQIIAEKAELRSGNIFSKGEQVVSLNDKQQQVILPGKTLPLAIFTYQPHERPGAQAVAYTFIANGVATSDPKQVLEIISNPQTPEVYWCKIEIAPLGISDAQETARIAERLLSRLMPEVMTCLPAIGGPGAEIKKAN